MSPTSFIPSRWQSLTLGLLALVFVSAFDASRVEAQSEARDPIVQITSIKAEKKDKKWVIKVKGEAPKLPEGVKVDFEMTWRSQVIETFREKIESPKRFEVLLSPKKGLATADGLQIKTVIYLKDIKSGRSVQSKSVRSAIDKDTKTFNPASKPWTDHHFDHEFRLATEEELEAELGAIRKYFEDRYVELAKLDRLVKSNAEAVREGTEFSTGDKLDTKKWRKWFDKDVVERLIELREETKKEYENKDFLPYRAALFNLEELTAAVAKRALSKQRKLYKEYGEELTKEFDEPENLDAETRRRRVTSGYLQNLVKNIQRELGMLKEEAKEEGQ